TVIETGAGASEDNAAPAAAAE
ncbi:MAG: hypothetical protein RLZZ56_529, partial [Actinomycetota bacterium]